MQSSCLKCILKSLVPNDQTFISYSFEQVSGRNSFATLLFKFCMYFHDCVNCGQIKSISKHGEDINELE